VDELIIGAGPLAPVDVVRAARNGTPLRVAPEALERAGFARAAIDQFVASGTPIYGVNTGVGSQKDHAVAEADMAAYNRKLIRAHGTRVPGPTAQPETVRATLILMINEHCHGLSGISPALIELLVKKANEDVMPEIDASGSVGASDLVPLAQLADWVLSDPRAKSAGLPAAKDGLCLINCNAFSLAVSCLCLEDLAQLMPAFMRASALSIEGFRGNLCKVRLPVGHFAY
jgi:histidine ammonia-lyase